MPTEIYHITHINNLSSILKSGRLVANSGLQKQQTLYTNIAHSQIQDRRANTFVPCAAGGCLHDYVPFYFAPRSPMLYAIHKGNVADYTEGQNPIIHLVSEAELVTANNLTFAFTDGHATMAYSEFYDDLQSLNKIDWQIMQKKYWRDTQEDGDRKRRRQAEFLIHQYCPWQLIKEIGVINSTLESQVRSILQKFNCNNSIKVYPSWYY